MCLEPARRGVSRLCWRLHPLPLGRVNDIRGASTTAHRTLFDRGQGSQPGLGTQVPQELPLQPLLIPELSLCLSPPTEMADHPLEPGPERALPGRGQAMLSPPAPPQSSLARRTGKMQVVGGGGLVPGPTKGTGRGLREVRDGHTPAENPQTLPEGLKSPGEPIRTGIGQSSDPACTNGTENMNGYSPVPRVIG